MVLHQCPALSKKQISVDFALICGTPYLSQLIDVSLLLSELHELKIMVAERMIK
tara:strand:+ start:997 stop:1158 length:162 start_codon:yes stop_codon:yes gene_type:complete